MGDANSRAFTSKNETRGGEAGRRRASSSIDYTHKRFVKAFNDSFMESAWASDTQSKRTRDSLFSFLFHLSLDIQSVPLQAMESFRNI